MIFIRSMNPETYRHGQWAHLFSIQHDEDGRDIWIVEFTDGDTDAWPSWDDEAQYEVRIQIEHPEGTDDQSQGLSARAAIQQMLNAAQQSLRHGVSGHRIQ